MLPKEGLSEVADFIEFLEEKRMKMEKREGKKGESDSLSDVIGICEGPSDLAERQDKYRKVTSDYVLDEVITALFRNVSFDSAVRFIESIFSKIKKGQLKLEWINKGRFESAWSLRERYQDKPDISFTDLTSFALMQELVVNKVFTGDTHFEEVNLGFKTIPRLDALRR